MLEEYEAHRAELVTPEAGFKIFLDFVGSRRRGPQRRIRRQHRQRPVRRPQGPAQARARRCGGPDEDVDRTELVRRFDTLKLSHALEPAILKAAGACAPSLAQAQGPHRGPPDSRAATPTRPTTTSRRPSACCAGSTPRPVRSSSSSGASSPTRASCACPTRSGRSCSPRCSSSTGNLMYRRMPADDEAILVQVFRQFIEALPNYTDDEGEIENIRKKLPLIYEYLDRVLINTTSQPTLYAQLQRNLVQINSLKEPGPLLERHHCATASSSPRSTRPRGSRVRQRHRHQRHRRHVPVLQEPRQGRHPRGRLQASTSPSAERSARSS